MSTTKRSDEPGRMLGYGGLALAIAGSIWLLLLADPSAALAIGLLGPLLVVVFMLAVPGMRRNSLIWLVLGLWSGLLAAMTIFSVGIIFLIATVFLLAAFLKANW